MSKNKYSIIFALFVLTLGLVSLAPKEADATVGGPTYIYDFRYNPADESAYYIEQSESGKGCPPALVRLPLVSGISETVFSCDQGSDLLQTSGRRDSYSVVDEAIAEITRTFKYVTPISLKANNISIDVDFLKVNYVTPDSTEWVLSRDFAVKVFQQNKKVYEFTLTGCDLVQPFHFTGYAIPGFNHKMLLLTSRKSNCWEGGYVGEVLNVLSGIDILDRTYTEGAYKYKSILSPNESTLVVFENEKVEIPKTIKDEPAQIEDIFTQEEKGVVSNDIEEESGEEGEEGSNLLIVFSALVGGLLVGYFLSRLVAKSRSENLG